MTPQNDRMVYWNGNTMTVATVGDTNISPAMEKNVGYNPGGSFSITSTAGRISTGDRLYSGLTGEVLINYPSPDGVFPSSIAPDGRYFGFIDGTVIRHIRGYEAEGTTLWLNQPQSSGGDYLRYLPNPVFDTISDSWKDVVLQVNSNYVQGYLVADDGLPYGRYSGSLLDVSADGTLFLMGNPSKPNELRIVDVRTGQTIRYFYPQNRYLNSIGVVSANFYDNDSKILIAWSYNYVEVYERTKPVRLEISPLARTLAEGQSQRYRMEAVYDDTTRVNVSPRSRSALLDLGPLAPDVASIGEAYIRVIPESAASVDGDTITVLPGAPATFTVEITYREFGNTLSATATVSVGQAIVAELRADPDRMTISPVVWQPFRYYARYADGYEEEVTAHTTVATDRRSVTEVDGQRVRVLLTAEPGDTIVTGTYRDEFGTAVTARSVISTFAPRTEWERYGVTPGGGITAGAFDTTGTKLLVATTAGTFNIWTKGTTPTNYTLDLVIPLPPDNREIETIRFLNSSSLFTFNSTGLLQKWGWPDLAAGSTASYDFGVPITAWQLAADNRTMALGTQAGEVILFDVETLAPSWRVAPHEGATTAVALGDVSGQNPARVISGGSDARIKVLSRADGSLARSLYAHTGSIVGLGFLQGFDIFYAVSSDARMTYWLNKDLQIVDVYELYDAPTSAFTRQGNLWIGTGSDTWMVYDSAGLLLRTHEVPPGGVVDEVFFTSDNYMITGRRNGMYSMQVYENQRFTQRGSMLDSSPLVGARADIDMGTGRFVTQSQRRTHVYTPGEANGTFTIDRLLETSTDGPMFRGMEFAKDGNLLATSISPSIYMIDLEQRILSRTLHVPGGTSVDSVRLHL